MASGVVLNVRVSAHDRIIMSKEEFSKFVMALYVVRVLLKCGTVFLCVSALDSKCCILCFLWLL